MTPEQLKDQAHKYDIQVGNNVRRYRELSKIPQEAVAAAIGVSFQQLQKYEKGENRISAGKIVQIARCLGRTVEDIFRIDVTSEVLERESQIAKELHELKTLRKFKRDVSKAMEGV